MFVFAIAGITFTFSAIFIHGVVGLYSLIGISVAMSIMFRTIYGIALRDMRDEA